MNLVITESSLNTYTLLTLSGEIDLHTYTDMMPFINRYSQDTSTLLLINMQQVSYIDSTGLGAIAKCAHHMEKRSGQIYIICNKPQIMTLFDIAGLTKRNITLFSSESDLKIAITS